MSNTPRRLSIIMLASPDSRERVGVARRPPVCGWGGRWLARRSRRPISHADGYRDRSIRHQRPCGRDAQFCSLIARCFPALHA